MSGNGDHQRRRVRSDRQPVRTAVTAGWAGPGGPSRQRPDAVPRRGTLGEVTGVALGEVPVSRSALRCGRARRVAAGPRHAAAEFGHAVAGAWATLRQSLGRAGAGAWPRCGRASPRCGRRLRRLRQALATLRQAAALGEWVGVPLLEALTRAAAGHHQTTGAPRRIAAAAGRSTGDGCCSRRRQRLCALEE